MRITFFVLFLVSISYGQNCFQNNTDAACATFRYPESQARADVEKLCMGKMGLVMPSCSIDRLCRNTERTEIKDSLFCEPFTTLKEGCADMKMGHICDDYTSLCAPGSVVEQCSTSILPLPKTMRAKNLTKSICMEMDMDGCSKCANETAGCDWLQVYSDLCLMMPEMSQCSAWKQMCLAIPAWPLCAISSEAPNDVVQMRMYFHTDYRDYILFKEWVPKDNTQYALSVLAVFTISVIYEFLKMIRSIAERRWERMYMGYAPIGDGVRGVFFAPFRFAVDVPRALLQFIEVMWGLFVMLIAMTYNVGLVVTIGVGAAVGTLLFGRYTKYDARPNSACH